MTDRAKYWGQMVGAWESSGLTQAEFCRRRGLKAVTFAWWKCRLVGVTGRGGRGRGRSRGARRPASLDPPVWVKVPPYAGQSKPSFVEVAFPGIGARSASKTSAPGAEGIGGHRSGCAGHPCVAGYEVALPCGTSIRLPADFDVDRASRLILALVTDDQAGSRSC